MRKRLTGKGKNMYKAHEIALSGQRTRVPVGEVVTRRPPRTEAEDEPEIGIDRAEDGTVRAITVRCPCGRTTTLQCEYFERGESDETE